MCAGCEFKNAQSPQTPAMAMAAVWLTREQVTMYWGPECPDYDPDCSVCEAWGRFTNSFDSRTQRGEVIVDLDNDRLFHHMMTDEEL